MPGDALQHEALGYCTNELAHNEPCPNKATHTVRIWQHRSLAAMPVCTGCVGPACVALTEAHGLPVGTRLVVRSL